MNTINLRVLRFKWTQEWERFELDLSPKSPLIKAHKMPIPESY